MVLGILNALPQQYSTAILLVLLLAAFIAAFKLLEMVFETIMVSVLSAGTYTAFTYLVYNSMPGLNDILLFAFAGASLYIGYSLLASAYTIAATIISVPYRLIKMTYSGLSTLIKKIVGGIMYSKDQRKEKKAREEDEEAVKEVVLDKMQGEEEKD